jgi:RND family efflux transporter MFP subunit
MIPILRLLRAAAGSDQDLLERYVRNRDEAAFEALVRRYGAGVWAACVRLAGHDADDAFQAVFLTLSRKAGTVSGSLPAWLHAVARRVASTLRRDARRRNAIEAAAARPDRIDGPDAGLREGLALLDYELSVLPERYRAVLIVCCLDGRSRDEAAVQLGWSEGQVKGRLERAREMLRTRLARRGVELGGLLLAAAVTGPAPVRANPPSSVAVSLTQGVIRTMLIQKFRLAAAVSAVCVCVVLAGGVALRAQPGDPNRIAKETPESPIAADGPRDKVKAPQDRLDESRKEIEFLRKRLEALEKKLPPPAPEGRTIVVSDLRATDVLVSRRYVGKILAHRHIEVRALTSGSVEEVLVKEGQAVKKGDVLFKMGSAIQKAKLDAEMAEFRIAKLEYDNTKKLFEQKTVSAQELALVEGKRMKAEARMKIAVVELDSTVVRAPFDGLIGHLRVQAGGAVKEGDALATLSDNSTGWVYFDVPEARYLEYMTDKGQVKAGAPVDLLLANGKAFPQSGKLAAVDGQFEQNTGNIAFRADFPNPDSLLRHGQSGTVLIRESLKNAIVVPQRAAFENGGKWYVYVVGKDDVAHRREIGIRNELGNLFVVNQGLEANDRVVVDGVRLVRDGEKVGDYEVRKSGEEK